MTRCNSRGGPNSCWAAATHHAEFPDCMSNLSDFGDGLQCMTRRGDVCHGTDGAVQRKGWDVLIESDTSLFWIPGDLKRHFSAFWGHCFQETTPSWALWSCQRKGYVSARTRNRNRFKHRNIQVSEELFQPSIPIADLTHCCGGPAVIEEVSAVYMSH